MNKNQLLAALFVSFAGTATPIAAWADERLQEADLTGFYGGLSMRDRGSESDGLQFGHISSAWGKFTLPATEDYGTRALAFGGFRWRNDIAVEAAVASADRFALQPEGAARPGMGFAFANGNEPAPKTWNADVYTSWGFAKQFALYGRLGYIQNEPAANLPNTLILSDVRRTRDGVNYGLGLRYDVTRALGLRFEYARYGRLAGEATSGLLPESDKVQLGVQFRF
jgi:opacity protein-like surface antigen